MVSVVSLPQPLTRSRGDEGSQHLKARLPSPCMSGASHTIPWSALYTWQSLRPHRSTNGHNLGSLFVSPGPFPPLPTLGNLVGIHRPQTSKTIVVSLLTFFFYLNAMTGFFYS